MNGLERDSGIDLLGYVPWGTHICQFYETPEDLTSTLVPYFKAGQKNNESCIWVTAEPLGKEPSLAAMRRAMPDFDHYLGNGQIEVVPHDKWFLQDGIFNLQMVFERMIDKLDHALRQGYDGLRVTSNTSWLEKHDWKRFTEYEEEINKIITKYRMMAICTYSLNRCSATEVIDVVNNHQFAIIKRQDRWQLMESTEHKQAEEAQRKAEENFHRSMDESPMGIRIVTPKGKTMYANRAILDIYGCSSVEELEAIPKRERYTLESYAGHQVRRKKRKLGDYVPPNYEISIVRKNGEIRRLEVFRKEVLWNGKPHFQVLYQDITERRWAEENSGYLASFPERNPNPILELDQKGNIKYANQAVKRIFPDLVTLGINHPFLADWPQVATEVQRNGCKTISREVVVDSLIYEQMISMVAKNLLCIYSLDITWRKHAEKALQQSEEKLHAMFESAAESITIIDLEGNILETNEATLSMYGVSNKEELIGRSSFENVSPKDLARFTKDFKRILREGHIGTREYTLLRKDKTGYPGEVSFALLRDKSENQVAVVSITRDITERKLMEEEMRQKEVEMVAACEADRLKTQLLSTVSHELRTPLASIKGYATMLLDYDKRLKLAQRRQCLELIDQASDRLMELISQLLDMSRLGAGLFRLSKVPTRIDKLIDKAVVEAQLRSPEHKFRTELKEDLPKLSVDSKRIHQVLDNLLENTIRYSPKGTEVIVRGETKPDVVEITVADQGRGIPASEIDKVFDRMYRLEHRLAQDPNGMGLGLPLCKGLVEAHSGRIWIDSREGKGTTVHFTLPLQTKQGGANAEKTQQKSGTGNRGRVGSSRVCLNSAEDGRVRSSAG